MTTEPNPTSDPQRRAFIAYFRGLESLLSPKGLSVSLVGKSLLFEAPALSMRALVDLRVVGGRVVFLPKNASVQADCTVRASGLFFQALAARAPIDRVLWAQCGLTVEGDASALGDLYTLAAGRSPSGVVPLQAGALGSRERPVRRAVRYKPASGPELF